MKVSRILLILCSKKKSRYSSDSLKRKKIDKLLMAMFTKDLQPASIVEDTEFKDFVHELDQAKQT